MNSKAGFVVRCLVPRSLTAGLLVGLTAITNAYADATDARYPRAEPVPAIGPKALAVPAAKLSTQVPAGPSIELPAVQSAEIEAAKERANRRGGRARMIGFRRTLSAAKAAESDSRRLVWHAVPGGAAAQMTIVSHGAAALRLEIEVAAAPPGAEVRFYAPGSSARVYGPLPLRAQAAGEPSFWSPVISGERITLEVFMPDGADVAGLQFSVRSVSHLLGSVETGLAKKALADLGSKSLSCNVDVVCSSYADVDKVAKMVGKLEFVDEGDSFVCTGTLINTTANSQIPYLFTAAHCINTPENASTLNTYWFYQAAWCGSKSPGPSLVHLWGGAQLLDVDLAHDESLVRLNDPAPNGAWFAGWDAAPVPSDSWVMDVHHPDGDLAKISVGKTTGTGYPPQFSEPFTTAIWTSGTTESGSSGSGLFTRSSTTSNYYLRGGLWGGTADCTGGIDYFSRFDLVYPRISTYLDPSTEWPTATGTVIEFYNWNLDHYFITSNQAEATAIDQGSAGPGWMRTGYTFNAGGSTPVCRFYGSLSPGPNSHFYTVDHDECAYLKQLQATTPSTLPRWNFESNDFLTTQPTNDTCAVGTVPVYRAYNNGFARQVDSNHRITSSQSAIQEVVARGWLNEGVVMCAPR